MDKLTWILLILGIITAYVIHYNYNREAPDLAPEPTYFGRGDAQPDDDVSIQEFKIKVPDQILTDLKRRISQTRWGEGYVNDFSYGMRIEYMKEITEYWANKYEWKKHEDILNTFGHFKTKIEGLDVHFIHVKPTNAKVVYPILLLHGWPGSVFDFYKVIPLLTEGPDVAFEVICPSIPGFGFSEAPHKKGFSPMAAGRVFHSLMQRLGHAQFYMQGGDFGSIIANIMSRQHPGRIKGVHINMIPMPMTSTLAIVHQVAAALFPSWFLNEGENFTTIADFIKLQLHEGGYLHFQATKPDTLGFGLIDSPVGLAAYILEKFQNAMSPYHMSLPDGGLTENFTLDELLNNVMIYWITGTIGSANRFYKELFNSPMSMKFESEPVTVPSGLAQFPFEAFHFPERFAAYTFHNIVQYTTMPSGGHHAALEKPHLLADDIKSFVLKVEGNQ